MSDASLPKLDRHVPKPGIWLFWAMFYVAIVPLNWLLTKLGRRPLLVSLMNRSQMGCKHAEVSRGYEPTRHDVFVSTFAKSGTNWMMQIAHQVSFRGEGDYEHIHDVVCWPDMGPKSTRRMSIPLDDTRVRAASPSHLRVIVSSRTTRTRQAQPK